MESSELIALGFLTYVTPVIVIAGVFLNTICFLTYSRKAFHKVASVFYLKALCVADSLALSRGIIYKLMFTGYSDPTLASNFSCKFTFFILYCTPAISAWLEGIVSIDRALAVAKPNAFKIRKTREFQWAVSFLVVGFNCLVYSPFLFFYEIVSWPAYELDSLNGTLANATIFADECTGPDEVMFIGGWIDIFNGMLFQFAVMITSSAVIIKHLATSRRNFNRAKGVKGQEKREKKDFRFSLTSIVVNINFILLNLGFFLADLIYLSFNISEDAYIITQSIASNLSFLNNGLKFIIYFCVNNIFRNELKKIVFPRAEAKT